MSNTDIKREILAALSHPEAEDGLYFNNLIIVHEEEETIYKLKGSLH